MLFWDARAGARALLAVVSAVAVLQLASPVALGAGNLSASAVQDDPAATELAERYAPVIRLRAQEEPCGDGTPYRPMDITTLMDNSGVALRGPWHTNDLVGVAPAAVDLTDGLPQYHLDFPGNALDPGCGYEEWQREIGRNSEATVYARVVTDPARQGQIALQYWFFYVFNDWNNNHEGDWEMIQLVFDAPDAEAALATPPSVVGYSQHTGGERASWGSAKLEVVDGTHPVVYPAEGSHANFFGSALYLGRSAETGVGCDDTNGPHDEIWPQVAVVPTEPDAYLDEFPWLGFQGRWGERHEAFFNGPTGPNMKTQWTAPVRWGEDGWRDDAVTVPLPAAVGPNVTNTFCSVVAAGSNVLRRALDDPAPVLIGLGAVLALLVVAAARTRWVPDAPYPVVQRRAAGQLLAASARMYALNWRLMLGIGLVYLPVMALAGVAQWLLVRAANLEALAGPDGDQNAWVIATVLLVGEVISLLAYFSVLAAVSGVLDDLAQGQLPSLRAAYGRVAAALRPLTGVAGRIVLVVGLLLLLVVTSPLALVYAVRRAFAVPAVAIENRSARGALQRSRQLVRGRWWPVALLLTIVVGFGAVSGPLVGVVLLLVFGGLSFALVNIIAGLVYAVAIPFVALVMSYLFFDLKMREPVVEEVPVPVG
ncbi:MAG TPA: Vps62-related protein [Jiangellaceae bacterium]